jgi:NADH dehydrogenase
MNNTTNAPRVVIVGGGFAGIEVARALGKSSLHIDVTLVSKDANFQYYPSLYRLVTGATINQVSIPLLRAVPKKVQLIIDTYSAVDPSQKNIELASGKKIAYDYLVMALGSEPNYFGINGMEQQSKSFLSIDKALGLKKYFSELIEKSKTQSPEEIKQTLHTIIVGAGPSGVELAGALPSYLKNLARQNGIDPTYICVDLLDSAPRVLQAIPENASALVAEQLRKQGVTIYTNYGVNSCDADCISVSDKNTSEPVEKKLQANTVIWTAGTKINGLFAAIPGVTLTDRKRVAVTDTLTLPIDSSIYIIGDGAGTPYSGLAQTAIDQGKYVGKALVMKLEGKTVDAYVPQAGIFVIPVGKQWAILNKKSFVASGAAAWLIRIAVDLHYFASITSIFYPFTMLKKSKQNND